MPIYTLTLCNGDVIANGFSVSASSLSDARELAIEGIALYAGEFERPVYEFSIRKDRTFNDTTSVLISQQEANDLLLTRAQQESVLKTPTVYMHLNAPLCIHIISATGCSFKEARERILNQLVMFFDDFKTYVPRFHIEVYDLAKHVKKEFTISRLEVTLRRDRLLKIKGGKQA